MRLSPQLIVSISDAKFLNKFTDSILGSSSELWIDADLVAYSYLPKIDLRGAVMWASSNLWPILR